MNDILPHPEPWRVPGCTCQIAAPGTRHEFRVLDRACPVHGDDQGTAHGPGSGFDATALEHARLDGAAMVETALDEGLLGLDLIEELLDYLTSLPVVEIKVSALEGIALGLVHAARDGRNLR